MYFSNGIKKCFGGLFPQELEAVDSFSVNMDQI